jgi:hypothetical protein
MVIRVEQGSAIINAFLDRPICRMSYSTLPGRQVEPNQRTAPGILV